jgi:hypothetical protein
MAVGIGLREGADHGDEKAGANLLAMGQEFFRAGLHECFLFWINQSIDGWMGDAGLAEHLVEE